MPSKKINKEEKIKYFLKVARRVGKKLAKKRPDSWWLERVKGLDAKALEKFIAKKSLPLHAWSDEFMMVVGDAYKIDWEDNRPEKAFFETYTAEVLKRIGKTLKISKTAGAAKLKTTTVSGLVQAAKMAGVLAGKTSALDEIDRSKNIPKQLNDLAENAWEHDGIPALEDVATEEEWESLYGKETCRAYTKAFIETIMKRLKR